MQPVELQSRREALGVSQRNLGELFDPPVKQSTVSQWEKGARGIPPGIDGALTELEELQDEIISGMVEIAESASSEVALLIPSPDAGNLPVSFQRVCAAHAVRDARELGKQARIMGA